MASKFLEEGFEHWKKQRLKTRLLGLRLLIDLGTTIPGYFEREELKFFKDYIEGLGGKIPELTTSERTLTPRQADSKLKAEPSTSEDSNFEEDFSKPSSSANWDSKFSAEDVYELKMLIKQIETEPTLLHTPDMDFFLDFISFFGGRLPEPHIPEGDIGVIELVDSDLKESESLGVRVERQMVMSKTVSEPYLSVIPSERFLEARTSVTKEYLPEVQNLTVTGLPKVNIPEKESISEQEPHLGSGEGVVEAILKPSKSGPSITYTDYSDLNEPEPTEALEERTKQQLVISDRTSEPHLRVIFSTSKSQERLVQDHIKSDLKGSESLGVRVERQIIMSKTVSEPYLSVIPSERFLEARTSVTKEYLPEVQNLTVTDLKGSESLGVRVERQIIMSKTVSEPYLSVIPSERFLEARTSVTKEYLPEVQNLTVTDLKESESLGVRVERQIIMSKTVSEPYLSVIPSERFLEARTSVTKEYLPEVQNLTETDATSMHSVKSEEGTVKVGKKVRFQAPEQEVGEEPSTSQTLHPIPNPDVKEADSKTSLKEQIKRHMVIRKSASEPHLLEVRSRFISARSSKSQGSLPEVQDLTRSDSEWSLKGMEKLPLEALECLASYLSDKDLAKCCTICISWREMFSAEELWKPKCNKKLANCLQNTKSLVEPRFVNPCPENSTLMPLTGWRLRFLKEKHFYQNLRTGKYTAYEIKFDRLADMWSRLGFPEVYDDKLRFDFFNTNLVFVHSLVDTQLWNVADEPTLVMKIPFQLTMFCKVYLCQFKGNRIIVARSNVVQIFDLCVPSRSWSFVKTFFFDKPEEYSLNIKKDTNIDSMVGTFVGDSVFGGVCGDFFIGVDTSDAALQRPAFHVWDINSCKKVKEVKCDQFGPHMHRIFLTASPTSPDTILLIFQREEDQIFSAYSLATLSFVASFVFPYGSSVILCHGYMCMFDIASRKVLWCDFAKKSLEYLIDDKRRSVKCWEAIKDEVVLSFSYRELFLINPKTKTMEVIDINYLDMAGFKILHNKYIVFNDDDQDIREVWEYDERNQFNREVAPAFLKRLCLPVRSGVFKTMNEVCARVVLNRNGHYVLNFW